MLSQLFLNSINDVIKNDFFNFWIYVRKKKLFLKKTKTSEFIENDVVVTFLHLFNKMMKKNFLKYFNDDTNEWIYWKRDCRNVQRRRLFK